MGGRPLEGLTMVGKTLVWTEELERWLKPFLNRLAHKARRRMCPLYVAGLIGPGERKSIQPMAERLVPGDYDQLHPRRRAILPLHSARPWDQLSRGTQRSSLAPHSSQRHFLEDSAGNRV